MTKAQLIQELKQLRYNQILFDTTELIAHTGHCVWNYQLDQIVSCSEEYARIYKMSIEEVIESQQNVESMLLQIHPDDQEYYLKIYKSLEVNKKHDIEYRIIRSDGEIRHIREVAILVAGEEGLDQDTLALLQDITEQKQAEKSLKEARDELEVRVEERTAELEQINIELEQFAYTISHDLKSPLVTVNGFIGLLGKDLEAGDDERVARDMQHIVSAISHMDRSLDDLLKLSRIGRVVNKLQPISFSQLSDEVKSILQGVITESEAEFEIAPDMPAVLADNHRISEVMQNLLENAIKFCGENNTPRISVNAKIQGSWVQCRVEDNGIGIDPRYHDKVFELFGRLDQSIEGTGIGLALVKRIIEIHDGETWIESEGIGQGTQVYFTLPAASEEMR